MNLVEKRDLLKKMATQVLKGEMDKAWSQRMPYGDPSDSALLKWAKLRDQARALDLDPRDVIYQPNLN